MTEFLSRRLTQHLVNRLQLNQNEIDLYELGIEVIISTMLTSASIFLISIILNNFAGAAFFLCCFITVRNYSGGFHAHTRTGCFITSIICYLSSYGLSKALIFLPLNAQTTIKGIGLAAAIGIFGAVAPLENPNKRLNEDWKHRNRRMMFIMLVLWLLICGGCMWLGKSNWADQVWATVIIMAVLLELARRQLCKR